MYNIKVSIRIISIPILLRPNRGEIKNKIKDFGAVKINSSSLIASNCE